MDAQPAKNNGGNYSSVPMNATIWDSSHFGFVRSDTAARARNLRQQREHFGSRRIYVAATSIPCFPSTHFQSATRQCS
jgi:hypothetical protein